MRVGIDMLFNHFPVGRAASCSGLQRGAVLLSIGAPMLAQMARVWLFPMNDFRSWVYAPGELFHSLAGAVLRSGPVLLAGSAPVYALLRRLGRRPVRHGALAGGRKTIRDLPQAFRHVKRSLWSVRRDHGFAAGIYLSGSIFIFGACLCAAHSEARSAPVDTIPARIIKGTEP